MAEDRISAITQQSIEAIVLLNNNSDETKLHFQTSRSAIVHPCASASGECAKSDGTTQLRDQFQGFSIIRRSRGRPSFFVVP